MLHSFAVRLLSGSGRDGILREVIAFTRHGGIAIILKVRSSVLTRSSYRTILFVISAYVAALPARSCSRVHFSMARQLTNNGTQARMYLLHSNSVLQLSRRRESLTSDRPLPASAFGLSVGSRRVATGSGIILPRLHIRVRRLAVARRRRRTRKQQVLTKSCSSRSPSSSLSVWVDGCGYGVWVN